jgi:translation initiation factor 2-alpha kinase 4
VRIADFSLGRRVRELVSAANHLRLEDPYPPSIGRGGKKSDIFRLGLVLASLVSGQRVEDQLPALRRGSGTALPASLEDFLGRCLWQEERDRWTAAQLLEHPFLRDSLPRPLLETPDQEAGGRPLNHRSPSPVLGRPSNLSFGVSDKRADHFCSLFRAVLWIRNDFFRV